jgi:hypothetical protein
MFQNVCCIVFQILSRIRFCRTNEKCVTFQMEQLSFFGHLSIRTIFVVHLKLSLETIVTSPNSKIESMVEHLQCPTAPCSRSPPGAYPSAMASVVETAIPHLHLDALTILIPPHFPPQLDPASLLPTPPRRAPPRLAPVAVPLSDHSFLIALTYSSALSHSIHCSHSPSQLSHK